MLKALLHRKWRLADGENADDDEHEDDGAGNSGWEGIDSLEDPLTAAVFERLSYLDLSSFWSLLRHAVDDASRRMLPEAQPSGEPAWWFWRRLPVGDRGRNTHTVEPDVLVIWQDAVLIVEAKHRGAQYAAQWLEQIHAVRANAELASKRIWFLAAGGTNPEDHGSNVKSVLAALGPRAPECLQLRWEALRRVLQESTCDRRSTATAAILADIGAALDAWGYRRKLGFDTLPRIAIELPITHTPAQLKTWRVR